MRDAIVVWGGWDGHEPEQVADVFTGILREAGMSVSVYDSLDVFDDADRLKSLHLIVPIWTMGEIENQRAENVSEAVANGTGIAGCHGGMCDAFRANVLWQFMTGGNWVSHPGGDGVTYTVNIHGGAGSLLEGLSDFQVTSEQYYLHVDPAVDVLATTRFPTVTWYHSPNGDVDMPVTWTKRWGAGRVFYTSLGHHADIFDIPEARETARRGLLWAADGKDEATRNGWSAADFQSEAKMF